MKRIALPLLFLILVCTTHAQERKQAPHNGYIKRAGYYTVEVVDCFGYLEVYLFEMNMRPVRNYGLEGLADFHYPDSTCTTSRLYPYGTDGFTAQAEREPYSSVDLFIRGRGISIRVMFKDIVCIRPEE